MLTGAMLARRAGMIVHHSWESDMTIARGLIDTINSLVKQISAHTGQPCRITLQPGDTSEGQHWAAFSDDASIILSAPDGDALCAQIKVYSQGYAAAIKGRP
jgi:hypothetical protein